METTILLIVCIVTVFVGVGLVVRASNRFNDRLHRIKRSFGVWDDPTDEKLRARVRQLLQRENDYMVLNEKWIQINNAIEGGVGTVLRERMRQIVEHDFKPERDDKYTEGQLVWAACEYLFYAGVQILTRSKGWDGYTVEEYREKWKDNGGVPSNWPKDWDKSWWKPSEDPARNMAKAGGLLCADLDRQERADQKALRDAHATVVAPAEDNRTPEQSAMYGDATLDAMNGWPGHDDASAKPPLKKPLIEPLDYSNDGQS